MKKQRKLLTTEEKENICSERGGICARKKGSDLCPLYFDIGVACFCYKEHIILLEDAIEKVHNEEIKI